MRESDPTPSDLQKALLGYEPSDLETALIDWTRENWPTAARGMVYARKEAADTVSGVSQVRDHDLKVVLEVAARVSIAEITVAVWPFLASNLVVLALVTAIPGLSLWLPSLFYQ